MKPLRQMTVVAIVAVGVIAAAVVLTFVSSRKRYADKPQSPLPIEDAEGQAPLVE